MAPQAMAFGAAGVLGSADSPVGPGEEQTDACTVHLRPGPAHSESARCSELYFEPPVPQKISLASVAMAPQMLWKLAWISHLAPPDFAQYCMAIFSAAARSPWSYDQPEIISFRLKAMAPKAGAAFLPLH